MIVISTAHSSKMKGAENKQYEINEYDVSKESSYRCFEVLRSNKIACTLFDCGDLTDKEYSVYKTTLINSMRPVPQLAIEIHLNSSADDKPRYGEVLYQDSNGSIVSKIAAECIAESLTDATDYTAHHIDYNSKGAQEPDKRDFFLYNIHCPSLIVEGFFISNSLDASWIKTGGAQAYGVLVADGILNWLRKV